MSRSRMRALLLFLLGCASCTGPSPIQGDMGPSPGNDAGSGNDAGTTPDDAGVPSSLVGLPNDVWSFVQIPGTVCGNGSPAAIGVNPHAGARDLLVVMEGGGACWDASTCFVLQSAVHVNEDYTRAIFDASIVGLHSFDDRASTTNPFRDYHLVFVPYCTGDIHGGDADQTYDPAQPERVVHHRGGRNMRAFIEAMRTAWPSLDQTLVLGFSAGGYGAQLHWGHFAEAWPTSTLRITADCSPLVQPAGSLYGTWRSAWNLDTPAGCTECGTTFAAYDDFFDGQHPTSRFALLATTRDAVISQYTGITDMPAALNVLAQDHLDHDTTTRYFVVDSDEHVLLDDQPPPTARDGTPLGDWIVWFLTDDPRWQSTP